MVVGKATVFEPVSESAKEKISGVSKVDGKKIRGLNFKTPFSIEN